MATLKKIHKIIIGGGTSASELIQQLADWVQRIPQLKPIEVEIIEATDTLARGGLGWNKKNLRDFHYANSYTSPEIANAIRPNSTSLQNQEVQRNHTGDDLEKEFNHFLEGIRQLGVPVTITTNRTAVNVQKDNNGKWIVTIEDGEEKKADSVIVATGNWQGKSKLNNNGIYRSPWPASALEEIISSQQTAIMGTSLGAIDASLTISHASGTFQKRPGETNMQFVPKDKNFKLVLYSPHGMLPSVLGDTVTRR
jgi:hypothetical protein